jgi:hypothetical protein
VKPGDRFAGTMVSPEKTAVPDRWIAFWRAGSSPSGKTQIWDVCTRMETVSIRGVHLGVIRWAAHWRKYSFFPNGGSWYEADCLRAIAAFCEQLTREHQKPAPAVDREGDL